MKKRFLLLVALLSLTACQLHRTELTLYQELGGNAVLERIADHFIEEIGYDPVIIRHFEQTDPKQFRASFIVHLCELSDGPCKYSGPPLQETHKKMRISEAEFNKTVDLLINAMNKSQVSLPTQNRLLARLARLRAEIIDSQSD